MSAADRLEDGFPHGTREGYEKGCRGSRCPATEDGWLSCAQARTRYQSDYAYRKRVDAGMTPAQLFEADEREAAEQRAQLAAARARRDGVASAPAPESVEPREAVPAVSAEEAAAIASAERSGVAYERHGTQSGYSAGCRAKEACPGIQRVGKSCTDAVNEYQRELKARRRAAEAPAQVVEAAPVEAIVEEATPLEQELIDVRRALAEEHKLRLEYGHEVAQAAKEVAVLEKKLTDALARNTVLTDRVASLELELDVAKAKVPTFEPVAQAVPAPLDVATDSEWPGAAALSEAALERMASTFRLMRVGEGVFVEVNGEAPGQVHFAFGEDGALSGVSVQSGK